MRIKANNKIKTIIKRLGGIIDLTGKNIEEIYFKERSKMKKPDWFKEFEKKNDKQWEGQMEFNGNVSKFIEQQLEFNGNVSKFMESQINFNESQMDFNSKIMLRLDNIVSKNNLTE